MKPSALAAVAHVASTPKPDDTGLQNDASRSAQPSRPRSRRRALPALIASSAAESAMPPYVTRAIGSRRLPAALTTRFALSTVRGRPLKPPSTPPGSIHHGRQRAGQHHGRRRTHSGLCHARHSRRRAARSDHRRARDADLSDHVLRVRRRRSRRLAVRPAGLRQHLHAHRQSDQRGAGRARRRARRRHRGPCGRLRPRRAGDRDALR